MSNIILRPVYDRPEMLYLSIEYENLARQLHMLPGNFITLFLIEHGSPQKTIELIQNYPFESMFEFRDRKYGLTVNILEGMKKAFSLTSDYVIYIEDDILIHQTYFKYMDILLNMEELKDQWSILSPFNHNDDGAVDVVKRGHHYAALAPLIDKVFYESYIGPCSTTDYYKNPAKFVRAINEQYKDHWGKGYKYRDATHHEQAGLINRLVDIAMIDEEKHVIMPEVNRQQHIGYFGKNRPGGIIRGNGFDERVENLRETIKDACKMYELSATKQYNDYLTFSPKLAEWNGTLNVK